MCACLTPEEFAVVKTHTTQGAAMLRRLENFENEPLLLECMMDIQDSLQEKLHKKHG